MRRNLIDAGRTCHNRLWTYLPPVGAFSLFCLLFDTVLYETLFSFKFG
uniref:2500003M10Rik protein n=1 Tax=Mus musculus TaxID=10090 RepID=Q99KL5_MOUSE|nr:2500003M10Rik protein [Mus musculus]